MRALARAYSLGGYDDPYVLQAAIAACHAQARSAEQTDWRRIANLYDLLSAAAPSPIVDLNRAVAHSMGYGPEVGLRMLEAISDAPVLQGYALLPAARGDFLFRCGRFSDAEVEFSRAADLSQNVRQQDFLRQRAAACRAQDSS